LIDGTAPTLARAITPAGALPDLGTQGRRPRPRSRGHHDRQV